MRNFHPGMGRLIACGLLLWGVGGVVRANGALGGHSQGPARKPAAPRALISRELKSAGTVRFPSPAPTALEPPAICSEAGDIYAAYDTTPPRPGLRALPSAHSPPVRRISPGSQSVTRYALRSLGNYQSFERMRFAVDRWNALYALYKAYRHPFDWQQLVPPDYLIVKFNSDGSVDTKAKLKGPPGGQLEPGAFAVFGNGNILVMGIFNTKPPAPRRGAAETSPIERRLVHQAPRSLRPFAGIFDPSGNFIQRLVLPGKADGRGSLTRSPAPGPAGAPPRNGLMATMETVLIADPDGGIYLLRPSYPAMLYLVSSDGRVLRHKSVEVPGGAGIPLAASMAGKSRLFLTLLGEVVGKNRQVHQTTIFAIIDPLTGKVAETYKLPSSNDNLMPVCADSPSEIMFLGSTKAGNLEVVKFSTE